MIASEPTLDFWACPAMYASPALNSIGEDGRTLQEVAVVTCPWLEVAAIGQEVPLARHYCFTVLFELQWPRYAPAEPIR